VVCGQILLRLKDKLPLLSVFFPSHRTKHLYDLRLTLQPAYGHKILENNKEIYDAFAGGQNKCLMSKLYAYCVQANRLLLLSGILLWQIKYGTVWLYQYLDNGPAESGDVDNVVVVTQPSDWRRGDPLHAVVFHTPASAVLSLSATRLPKIIIIIIIIIRQLIRRRNMSTKSLQGRTTTFSRY